MAEDNSLMARVTAWPEQTKNYFEELHLEMKRVTWPAWKQVQGTTIVVIVSVFAFAAYFAIVDAIFQRAVQKLFDTFTK